MQKTSKNFTQKIILFLCAFFMLHGIIFVQAPHALANEAITYYEQGMTEQAKGNWELSYALLKQSAQMGYGKAQYELGVLYENGQGVAQDMEKATLWYRQAAKENQMTTEEKPKTLYEKSKEGIADTVKDAEDGFDHAKEDLGEFYDKSKKSISESTEDARSWTKDTYNKSIDGIQRFLNDIKSE